MRNGPIVLAFAVVGSGAGLGAQLPAHPQNLRVLPKTLTTDSVFNLMLNVADGLGVTCGYCHVGGDNRTWDSTNFAADVKPTKVAAREMFSSSSGSTENCWRLFSRRVAR